MKIESFQAIVAELDQLTPHQRRVLIDKLRASGGSKEVLAILESRTQAKPTCPHCKANNVSRWGSASGLQRYRCQTCKATFNTLTGSPLARLRHKEQWLNYSQQLAQGQSIRKSAKVCDVHRNTAFRWRHRFLSLPEMQRASQLAGIAEADETVFLTSLKGKKQGLSRAPRKRGGKASKRGMSDEQTPVLICRDRAGNMADYVLDKADKAHIEAALKPILAKDAILCTDGGKALAAVARSLGITHRPVNLSAGIRVIAGVYHVQNVNAYDSRLKGWMQRFHGVATRYLSRYLGWRRLIERCGSETSPQNILLAALGLPLQQLRVT